MQITFDPLVPAEVEAVKNFLSRDSRTTIVHLTGTGGGSGGSYSTPLPAIDSKLLDPADDPSAGAEAPSAAPLPPVPVPSTAAVTLFPTAPAAPQASVPPAPPVPSPPVPAAPPPAPAPTANAAPVPPAGDVDSTGLPWDERIHASTKTMNADGTWRQRRGLNDPGLVKRVEAELRASDAVSVSQPGPNHAGEVPNVPPAPSAATAVVPPPPVTPVTPVAVPAPPVPAGASSVVPIAPRASEQALIPASEPIDFGGLMALLTGLVSSGKVTESQVHEILRSVELDPHQIGVLAGDSGKTQQVADALRALVGA